MEIQFHCLNVIPVRGRIEFREVKQEETIPRSFFASNAATTDSFNPLTPNAHYSGRTAPPTSKRCILYIYSTNIGNEYFKHGTYSPFFPLQNAVCFIILTYFVPVLFTFYIQNVLKLKKIIPDSKRLTRHWAHYRALMYGSIKHRKFVDVSSSFCCLGNSDHIKPMRRDGGV